MIEHSSRFYCESCCNHICDHYRRDNAIAYFKQIKKFSFHSLDSFIVFNKQKSRKERPYCEYCHQQLDSIALLKLSDFKFKLIEIEQAILQFDQLLLPKCYLCGKLAFQNPNKGELSQKENSKDEWVHEICEIQMLKLKNCHHIINAAQLDLELSKFENMMGKKLTEERCFVNELERPYKIEFPKCRDCLAIIDGKDIQRIRPGDIDWYQYNCKVTKYQNWNLVCCELCNEEIGNGGTPGTAKHSECIKTRIKLSNCGCVFVKEHFMEMMGIKANHEFKVKQLFNFHSCQVQAKKCPGSNGGNCGRKIELRDLEDLTGQVDIDRQEYEKWKKYSFSKCSICQKEIGIQLSKQTGLNEVSHYSCASKFVKLECGKVIQKDQVKMVIKQQGLGIEGPEELFCSDIEKEIKRMPQCPHCDQIMSFQELVNLLDLDAKDRPQFALKYKQVKNLSLPFCEICRERRVDDKLVKLSDGFFYHFNTCIQKQIRLNCCGALYPKRPYLEKYPKTSESDTKIGKFFIFNKQQQKFVAPQCIQCKSELQWPTIEQLLIKKDYMPGKEDQKEFYKWVETSKDCSKCFLCNGKDKWSNLYLYQLCQGLHIRAHRNQMSELIRHDCSFQVKRKNWMKSICQEFGNILKDHSLIFQAQGNQVHRPYCPHCNINLKLKMLNKIFYGKINSDKYQRLKKKSEMVTGIENTQNFKKKIEKEPEDNMTIDQI